MKPILLQWMLLGLGLLVLLFVEPIPALAEQNVHATPAPAPVASSISPGLPPSTKINANATTSPTTTIQIVQTQAKTTNSTELFKELEKPISKSNTTMENMAKGRKIKITDTPTVHPIVIPKTATSAPSPPESGNSTKTTTNPKSGQEQLVAEGVPSSVIGNSTSTAKSVKATTSTSPTKSTTTTTTTTTAPQGKPKVVYSMDIHPEWEKDRDMPLAANVSASAAPSSTLPEPEPPIVQPSQELSGNLADRGGNEYIVPIVTVLLTVPLAIGVTIVMYRRFREMWSTRHYRRMDFLVDGMYND